MTEDGHFSAGTPRRYFLERKNRDKAKRDGEIRVHEAAKGVETGNPRHWPQL